MWRLLLPCLCHCVLQRKCSADGLCQQWSAAISNDATSAAGRRRRKLSDLYGLGHWLPFFQLGTQTGKQPSVDCLSIRYVYDQWGNENCPFNIYRLAV